VAVSFIGRENKTTWRKLLICHILNGNLSTDDKGIKQYEWIKLADDKLAADMTVSTVNLSKVVPP
jgi:hypothetical protein